ncbi:MAG TPA: long-chain fatty acid--CoA ligase [Desulfobulbus sp.]|nr:long-chain fatty acid--CoA ligase [Desulfobulbus sp.]
MTESNLPAVQHQAGTLNQLIDKSSERFGDHAAIGMALEKPLTYAEFHDRIFLLAAHLRDCGVGQGDRVALLAENSHNWCAAYMAIVRLGAVAVPILPDLPEADVHHILTEMECDCIFLTQRQIDKIYDIKKKLTTVVTLDDYVEDAGLLKVQTFSEYLAAAATRFSQDLARGQLQFPEVGSDDPASILYTSGTSGFSKAVMLSHANLCANAYATASVIVLTPGSVFLSVLPVAHTYEFTVGFLMPLIKGARIAYAGKAPTPAVLQKLCAVERPHVMLVVPLVMEKIYKKRVLPIIEKNRMLSMLCRFAIGRRLTHRKIGKKLEQFFGGRLAVMGIGGAALNPEVESFLREAGFPFLIGYGMTESAPLISGGPKGDNTIRPGSAGRPVPGVQVRINDPDAETGIGEIQVKGPNVMQGYWNDPEATIATFTDDGWLKTGDLGFLDDLENLHIRGRSKSVIVLANGENVYPEVIEHKLNRYPLVTESLVVENRGMLEAWIYPDYELVDEETARQSRQQRHVYITSQLELIRTEVNEQLPSTSRLSRILERREPFIKTATHKIKRYLYTAETMPG